MVHVHIMHRVNEAGSIEMAGKSRQCNCDDQKTKMLRIGCVLSTSHIGVPVKLAKSISSGVSTCSLLQASQYLNEVV